MKINNIFKNTYYAILLLIPMGWFLNGRYYFSRFVSEGFDQILCWILSVGLVIFASFLFGSYNYLKQKKTKIRFLFFIGYCILALYSINCTAAGQYWDQQKKNQEININQIDKENTAYLIERYQEKIKQVQKEYDKLNEMRDKTLEDLNDLYNWKNTTKTVEQMKDKINKDLKEYEIKLENLIKENKVSAKNKENIKMSKTLYIFYVKIFSLEGENPEENVQFIFQIILSIIIESIAQLSILIFMKVKFFNKKKEYKHIYAPVKITANDLRHFSVIAWKGIDKKQCKNILNKTTFMEIAKKVNPGFSENKYKLIMKKAIEKELIKRIDKKYYPGSDFVNQEFFYKKMCQIMNFA